mgnify:CR=1 FL=1
MIDLLTARNEDLNIGMQLLRDEFIKKGWKARSAYIGSAIIHIDRGDGKIMTVFSTTPPTTSYGAGYMANDKFATYTLLESIGARQLESAIVTERVGIEDAVALMNRVGLVVVKPIDGGHGKGITVGVSSREQLEIAVEYARSFTKSSNRVLVQKQYPHEKMYDIRLACIDGKFVAATWRTPATIVGDGIQTVGEIIDRENESDKRGVPYYALLATIDVDSAKNYLGEKYNSVPEVDEEVQVIGVANYGAGGEIIDATDDIPEWMIVEAERVSRAAGLYVSGVDYLLAQPPRVDATINELDPVIIELNKCPSLAIHDTPTRGKARGAVAAYVEYLSKIDI